MLGGAKKGRARLDSHATALVEASHSQRFAGRPRCRRTVLQHLGRPGSDHRQGHEVEPVVLHDGIKSTRVARADEMKVACGDLETRDIAFANVAAQALLEAAQLATARVAPRKGAPDVV